MFQAAVDRRVEAARARFWQVNESVPDNDGPDTETAVLDALSGPMGRLLPPTLDDLTDAYGGH